MRTIESRLRVLLGSAPNSYWEEKIKSAPGHWGERILSQLVFAHELSKVQDGRFDRTIEEALSLVESRIAEEAVLTRNTALEAEKLLAELASEAKSYEILSVAHAHIDMNWMWGWDETVSVTLDTMRTMLNLLDEYPQFTFSQSQASIYRIVEQYAPDMLEEIKRRVSEGRWEVTASHWVEADKNMPSGESLTRHLLYTKRYLSSLLGIDPDSLNLDFEPDTFGHSVNVPDILAAGGVRYYYHCRGYDGHVLYRWKAPSGQSVIVYREPTWYNDTVQPMLGAYVPELCRQTGLKTHLNVYGVGDHGGGPTRRDLERLIGMNDWPVYPRIRFGTLADYFRLAEPLADRLPVVEGELNFVFTGCYTSQSRIKTANRIGEAALNEAETFAAVASLAEGKRYPRDAFEEAWRNVLFNQFHDILPGSGVLETREHALGLFQQTMAAAGASRKLALESIAAGIDTSSLVGDSDGGSVSEGAGVGFGIREFKPGQVERGRGRKRIVHLFNPSLCEREEAVEVVLWDWKSPIQTLCVRDGEGRETPYQLVDKGHHYYWGHDYTRLLLYAKAPAGGYSTYTIEEGDGSSAPKMPVEPLVEREEPLVLENECLRAEFHPVTAAVVSLIDKTTGEELVDASRPAGLFRFIEEDPVRGMTAWQVGRYLDIHSLHQRVKIRRGAAGSVRQSLHYELSFGRSKLNVTVSLDRSSRRLDFATECDWQEAGKAETAIPQLNFHWPLGYKCTAYRYDVPFGTVERQPLEMDVPGNSWALGVRGEAEKPAVMIVTSNKYGFRGTDDSLAVSLIRSSFDPDPYPELGNHHRTRLSVCLTDDRVNGELIETASRLNHPLNVLSGTPHAGTRPLAAGFIELLEGSVAVSSVKMAEDGGRAWVVRVYETEGLPTTAKLRLFRAATRAYCVDANEKPVESGSPAVVEGDTVSFAVPAYTSVAILLQFD
ncbi:alpha-mannosidase [Paenibacillus hodogayensis]|uniref:Alpha-mannosidase n=1 Tax=Paenibacillus hodogayensis TaxID=279208 RepID=A0ABV5VRE2_9BACL